MKLEAGVEVPKHPPIVTLYPPFPKIFLAPSSPHFFEQLRFQQLCSCCHFFRTLMSCLARDAPAGRAELGSSAISVDVHPWGYRSGMCDTDPVIRASEGCSSLGKTFHQPQGLWSIALLQLEGMDTLEHLADGEGREGSTQTLSVPCSIIGQSRI